MRNRRKVILGVALSFMILFTCVGYAALNDTLSISGSMSATAPNELYITEIVSNCSTAISGYTSMDTTISDGQGVYAVTVKNNHPDITYVYTGATVTGGNATITAWYAGTEDDQYKIPENETYTFSEIENDTDAYISGLPIAPGEELTFQVLLKSADSTTFGVEFLFAEVKYSITYINNGEMLDIRCVLNNSKEVFTENATAADAAVSGMAEQGYNVEFGYWMNAGSSEVESVPANYPLEEDDPTEITLYPKFENLYTAMFVDQDGSLFAWCFFSSTNYQTTVEAARTDAETALEASLSADLELDYWQVVGDKINAAYDIDNFASYSEDVTIYPVYKYNGDVQLIPIDEDGDGATDYYQVGGYKSTESPTALVEIPDSVNGIKVKEINADAFSSYDDLHAVRIPGTIETINAAVFSDSTWDRQTVTLYFDGDADTFRNYMDYFYIIECTGNTQSDYMDANGVTETQATSTIFESSWDSGMGYGSRIFFLKDGKVDESAGYWELYAVKTTFIVTSYSRFRWVYHDHPYVESHPTDCSRNICETAFTDYTGYCTCGNDCCLDENGNATLRPDAQYWTTTTTTSEEEETS